MQYLQLLMVGVGSRNQPSNRVHQRIRLGTIKKVNRLECFTQMIERAILVLDARHATHRDHLGASYCLVPFIKADRDRLTKVEGGIFRGGGDVHEVMASADFGVGQSAWLWAEHQRDWAGIRLRGQCRQQLARCQVLLIAVDTGC